MASFGENFKKIRLTLGWTQQDAAEHIGLQTTAISRIENGKDPGLKNIRKICRGLSCSPNVLIDI